VPPAPSGILTTGGHRKLCSMYSGRRLRLLHSMRQLNVPFDDWSPYALSRKHRWQTRLQCRGELGAADRAASILGAARSTP
jgi:hypothetical protein